MGDGESRERLKRWRGVRQDSGDSKEFAKMAKKRYEELGVESGKKVVIYSDGESCLVEDVRQMGKGASPPDLLVQIEAADILLRVLSGLDVDRCLELQKYSREIGIGAGFGELCFSLFRLLTLSSPFKSRSNSVLIFLL